MNEDFNNAKLFLEFSNFDEAKAHSLSESYWRKQHEDFRKYIEYKYPNKSINCCFIVGILSMMTSTISLGLEAYWCFGSLFMLSGICMFRAAFLILRRNKIPDFQRITVKHWLCEFADLDT